MYTDSTANSIVIATDKMVVTAGIEDLVIVETGDAVLVVDKKSVQSVKNIVNQLKVEESGLLEVEWIDDYKQSTFKRSVVNVYDDEGNEIFPLRFNKASQLED